MHCHSVATSQSYRKKRLAHTNRHIQFIDTSNLFIMMRTWLLLHSFQHVASKRMRMHRQTCVHTHDGLVCGGASALDRSLAPKDGWVDQNYRQRRHLIQNVSIVKVTLVSACLCCVECFRSCRLTSYVSVRCFHSSMLQPTSTHHPKPAKPYGTGWWSVFVCILWYTNATTFSMETSFLFSSLFASKLLHDLDNGSCWIHQVNENKCVFSPSLFCLNRLILSRLNKTKQQQQQRRQKNEVENAREKYIRNRHQ